jgi:hypothetical protein
MSVAICIFLLTGIRTASATHYIGERWAGGAIFWFSNAAKTHGLVVDTTDLSAGANWATAVTLGTYPLHGPGWHLPTIAELHLLCLNASAVNLAMPGCTSPIQRTAASYYWSNTTSGVNARRERFSNCVSLPLVLKASLNRVRAVKAW